MSDVWSIRGVPENTQRRAKQAAKHSGLSVGELVTECINYRLNLRREDDILYVIQRLERQVSVINAEQKNIAHDVGALYTQVAEARRDAVRSFTVQHEDYDNKAAADQKVTTLYDLIKAYERVNGSLRERLPERHPSRINKDAG